MVNPLSTWNYSSQYEQISLDDEDEDDYDSLEYQFSSYGDAGLSLFREFLFKLDNLEHFEYILYHWVIGNQLIFKYTNRIEEKDLLRALVSVFRVRRVHLIIN